jgi:hypothetical protein
VASPMRKVRAWSTREDDAESKETAAFEATVAAAKDTAAKSGAFLSTAKSDLTDHRRWLQAQSVAVERDRMRHERWLQRQREHRLNLARRERTRRKRQFMRQRAFRAIRQTTWAAVLYVRSLVVLALAKTVAGIKYVAALIARSIAFAAARLADFVCSIARLVAAGARWTAAKLGAIARWLGLVLSAGFAWSGAKARAAAGASGAALSAGSRFTVAKTKSSACVGGAALSASFRFAAAKAQSAARAGGAALTTGSRFVAAKAHSWVRSGGAAVAAGSFAMAHRAGTFGGAAGRSLKSGASFALSKAAAFAAATKQQLAAGFRWSAGKAQMLAPAVYVGMARVGRQAERYAKASAACTEGMFARAKAEAAPARAEAAPPVPQPEEPEVYGPFPRGFMIDGVSLNEPRMPAPPPPVMPRVGAENALSMRARTALVGARSGIGAAWARSRSWVQTRDVDLSQMMIVAGAVLLVCGALLLGGGLYLRAGAGTAPAAPQAVEEAPHGIAWTFEEDDLPLPARAVFTLSGTPASFRINGLSLSGTNLSDQPLTGVEAVLKPDVQRPALKLSLQVDEAAVPAGEGDTEAQALDIVPAKTIPPRTPFRLVFPFPPEAMDGEDGITVEDFFESYGGLLLKLRFEIDGQERTIIQYLPPDLLKAQLDEVAAEAGGT